MHHPGKYSKILAYSIDMSYMKKSKFFSLAICINMLIKNTKRFVDATSTLVDWKEWFYWSILKNLATYKIILLDYRNN